jgi:tetratricopeptide (TPR) repeat protein
MASKIEIFFCYARKDEKLLKDLRAHLAPLYRQGIIDIWQDREISAGAVWAKEIHKHLNSAHIILLLVSPDFIDSDYCYSIEMKEAMERHERGEVQVIPVILRQVYWQDAPFGKLQALPTDAKPVTGRYWYNHQDEALDDVAQGIRNAIQKISNPNVIQESPNQPAKPTVTPVAIDPSLVSLPIQTYWDGAKSQAMKKQLLDEGFNLSKAKRYREALAKYEQALQIDPKDALAHSNKCYILCELHEYENAVKAYEQALLIYPKDVSVWIDKGRALNILKKYDEGLAACEQALRLDSSNVLALNNKSLALLGLEQYQDVIAVCEQVLRIDGKNDIAYNNKGAALEGLRNDSVPSFQ